MRCRVEEELNKQADAEIALQKRHDSILYDAINSGDFEQAVDIKLHRQFQSIDFINENIDFYAFAPDSEFDLADRQKLGSAFLKRRWMTMWMLLLNVFEAMEHWETESIRESLKENPEQIEVILNDN